MRETSTNRLENFYTQVQQKANLPTPQHARRWTTGILKSLGLQLDGGTKRALAKALPKELARDLTGVFWLLHFRNGRLTTGEFQRQVGLRSGNTDSQYARQPIVAVFGAVKGMIDKEMKDKVEKSLPAAIGELWREA
jgi:uncharacterized protein (DUF2267 family)